MSGTMRISIIAEEGKQEKQKPFQNRMPSVRLQTHIRILCERDARIANAVTNHFERSFFLWFYYFY